MESPNEPEIAEMELPSEPETTEMDFPSLPIFQSVEDECKYWKERYQQYEEKYDEIVEQSRMMKIEMDDTLQQNENIIKDLTSNLSMLELEKESLVLSLDSQNKDMTYMKKELESVKKERDIMNSLALRQLKRESDSQGQAFHLLNKCVMNFEKVLDHAYELEVDEKGVMHRKLERVRAETRELKKKYVKTGYVLPKVTGTSIVARWFSDYDLRIATNAALNAVSNATTNAAIDAAIDATTNAITAATNVVNSLNAEQQQISTENSGNLGNDDMFRGLNAIDSNLQTYGQSSSGQ